MSHISHLSSYHRKLTFFTAAGTEDYTHIDVYDVLKAFRVECHATGHAIKKLLCAGSRGHKDKETDLKEAIAAIERAIDLSRESII